MIDLEKQFFVKVTSDKYTSCSKLSNQSRRTFDKLLKGSEIYFSYSEKRFFFYRPSLCNAPI